MRRAFTIKASSIKTADRKRAKYAILMGYMPSNNAILAYLDSFQDSPLVLKLNKNFKERDSLELLLKEIMVLGNLDSSSISADAHAKNIKRAKKFFTPYALKQWQLNVLLEVLRCQIRSGLTEKPISSETKEAIIAATVLTTLLNVISRKGMSGPFVDESLNFGGCDLIHLCAGESAESLDPNKYRLGNRTALVCADDDKYYKITVKSRSFYEELTQSFDPNQPSYDVVSLDQEIQKISDDKAAVVGSLKGIANTGRYAKANAELLGKIKSLYNKNAMVECDLIPPPSSENFDTQNSCAIESYIKSIYVGKDFRDSYPYYGITQYGDEIYSIEYVKDKKSSDFKWSMVLLETAAEKILDIFSEQGEGKIRSAFSTELGPINALLHTNCQNNREKELRYLVKNHCKFSMDSLEDCRDGVIPATSSSWLCERIQTYMETFNDIRLGGIRERRLHRFVGDFLVAYDFLYEYGVAWKNMNKWMEEHGLLFIFSNVGVYFFLPRLMRNCAIMIYHTTFFDSKLAPLEAAMDRTTRFRIHWTRFWYETINDGYWLANGLTFRFLFYGVVNATTINISLLTQIADLVNIVTRTILELRRLRDLERGILQQNNNLSSSLHIHLQDRIGFEQRFLMYSIFHFLVLLTAMCMTLPQAAVIHPILPVIGGACSVIITIVTWWVRSEFKEAKKTYKPDSLESVPIASIKSSSINTFMAR